MEIRNQAWVYGNGWKGMGWLSVMEKGRTCSSWQWVVVMTGAATTRSWSRVRWTDYNLDSFSGCSQCWNYHYRPTLFSIAWVLFAVDSA